MFLTLTVKGSQQVQDKSSRFSWGQTESERTLESEDSTQQELKHKTKQVMKSLEIGGSSDSAGSRCFTWGSREVKCVAVAERRREQSSHGPPESGFVRQRPSLAGTLG